MYRHNSYTILSSGNSLMWILAIIIFLIFPLGAVIFAFAFLLTNNNRSAFLQFAIIYILYISFVNISKEVSSDPDLPWYTEQYKMAGKMSYVKYVFWFGVNGKGRELFFPTYNYFVYFIAGNNINLYRLILSITCYSFSFYGILRMGEYMKVPYWKISIPIIWFACFPWVFTYSQTILRQFLASSMLMMILVERFFYNRKMIIPSICMVLTHSTAFIFLPFLYVSAFRKPVKIRTALSFLLVLLAFVFIQSIASYLHSFLGSSDNALSYVLKRASANTIYELSPLGIGKILFLLFFSIVCIFSYYISSVRKRVLKYKSEKHVTFVNVFVIFSAFVVANKEQLELSNRLFSYAAMLSAFPFLYLINYYKTNKAVCLSFFGIMNLLLILYFTHSKYYNYDIPYGLLIHPMQFLY